MPDSPKKLRLAAGLAMLLFASPALAEDWRVAITVDSVPEFGRSIGFVDRDSIARDGNGIRFVYEVRFERASVDGAAVDAMRMSVRADCAALWYEIRSIEGYSGTTLIGRTTPSERLNAEQGSNIHGILTAACTDAYESGTVDPAGHARVAFGRIT